MSEIPQELLWKAGEVLDDINMNDASASVAIARAILAERKRCAEVARQWNNLQLDGWWIADTIADQIEGGT